MIQLNAIVVAKSHGMRWYDLGGIDPEANPGVYHFKKGLSGTEVRAAGPYEVRPGGLTGRITLAGETVYRAYRQLGARFSSRTWRRIRRSGQERVAQETRGFELR